MPPTRMVRLAMVTARLSREPTGESTHEATVPLADFSESTCASNNRSDRSATGPLDTVSRSAGLEPKPQPAKGPTADGFRPHRHAASSLVDRIGAHTEGAYGRGVIRLLIRRAKRTDTLDATELQGVIAGQTRRVGSPPSALLVRGRYGEFGAPLDYLLLRNDWPGPGPHLAVDIELR